MFKIETNKVFGLKMQTLRSLYGIAHRGVLAKSASLVNYGNGPTVYAEYICHGGIKVKSMDQAIAAARWLNRHRRKFLATKMLCEYCGKCS